MKDTLVCPKCTHRRIWHVARATEDAGGGAVQPLAVVTRTHAWGANERVGQFELMICERCSYTEWYAKDLGKLHEDENRGIRLIRNEIDVETGSEGGPYR